MKPRFLFLAAMALMGMSACHNEMELPGEGSPAEVNTYMTLKITGDGLREVRTLPDKGSGSQGISAGEPGERKISNLMVFLYDEEGVIKKTYVTESVRNTPEGAETDIFPIVTGKYYVYVIANFSDSEARWASVPGVDMRGLTIEDVSMAMMRNHYAKNDHFIMSNACNGTDDVTGAAVDVAVTNTYLNPATCVVKLDRLAVKISSKLGMLNIDGIEAGLDDSLFPVIGVTLKGFKLLNGATRTYVQQRWTGKKPTVYPYKNNLVTPWLVEEGNPAIFNYYNKLSDFRTVTLDADDKYTFVRDNYARMNFYDSVDGPVYCMENNPTWDGTGVVDAMKGNTTGLVYQFLMNHDGSDNLAGTNCFYAYGGNFFPSLAEVQKKYFNAFDDGSPVTDGPAELAAAQEELKQAYASDDLEDAIAKFRAKYQIKVYMDGLMYYIYYIKDKNYVEAEQNYYAVMRNTIYDLTVQKLLRVGDDIPGGWDPDTRPVDPVDPTNTYMNVHVEVNPWVLNSEDIELK